MQKVAFKSNYIKKIFKLWTSWYDMSLW